MNTAIGDWICADCGRHLQRSANSWPISTWHPGRCDYCGKSDVPVTQPRDFGYPTLPADAMKARAR